VRIYHSRRKPTSAVRSSQIIVQHCSFLFPLKMWTHFFIALIAQACWSMSLTIKPISNAATLDSKNHNNSITASLIPLASKNLSSTGQGPSTFNKSEPTSLTAPLPLTPEYYHELIDEGIFQVLSAYRDAKPFKISYNGPSHMDSPSQISHLAIEFSISDDQRLNLETFWPAPDSRALEWNWNQLNQFTSYFEDYPITWPTELDLFDAYDLTKALSEGELLDFCQGFYMVDWKHPDQGEVYRFRDLLGHQWDLSTRTRTLANGANLLKEI